MKTAFTDYYPPTKAEFAELWERGIISVDANVLLNVYRYPPAARSQLLDTLTGFQERLWCSHQAGREFHRNRLTVIKKQIEPYNQAIGFAQELRSKLVAARSGAFLPESVRDLHWKAVDALIRDLESSKEEHRRLLEEDPLGGRITALFEGRVGADYSEGKRREHLAEARRRYDAGVPPGYCDAKDDLKKPELERGGDYLLWSQLVEHAKSQKRPMMLISDDVKEDWRLEVDGKKLGPRTELVAEMRAVAGVAFWSYDAKQFMKWGGEWLKKPAPPRALVEAREVQEALVPRDGVVKRLTDKGFGFITPGGDSVDVFFHSSALVGVGYAQLRVGDIVRFFLEASEKGRRATNVERM